MSEYRHEPVLLQEVLKALSIRHDGIYLDATYGRGGHSEAILGGIGDNGMLIVMDRDPDAVSSAREKFGGEPRMQIRHGPFSCLARTTSSFGVHGRLNGVLFDLGVSSPQLDDGERGFSFQHGGPLDMRMDPASGISAAQWLEKVSRKDLERVIRQYGEERFAGRIARTIIERRSTAPIRTTDDLATLVASAVPKKEPGKHPATRTFQAIRIAVNQELQELDAALPQALDALAPGGRMAVITFHSLEDKAVKTFFRRAASGDDFPPDLPVPDSQMNRRARVIGGPVRPGHDELRANPRSRSATLRVAEKLAGGHT